MKAVAITGVRQAELIDLPEPHARGHWVVVKVHTAPMCTEYKAWLAGAPTQNLGHEAVGEVVEVAQPGRLHVGDRVVVMPLYACGQCQLCLSGDFIHCQNGTSVEAFTGSPVGSSTYAQYLLKPDWMAPRIPEDMPYDLAGLALCALGPSFGAMDRMNVTALDTILITGLGPVGLGAVVNAAYRGARVIAMDSVPFRAAYARRLGAETVLDPNDTQALQAVLELTTGLGVDKALDCSGTVAAQRFCLDAVRRRGQVAFVGECNEPLELIVSPDLLRKGIAVLGSWHYNLNLYPQVLQVIRRSPVAAQLISHTFPLSQVQQALALSATHETAKIMLHPWE
ncbi:MAG: zinc-binding dehydrogenase [Chloroflexi bacterium]|nr:zinc-binding dehydrogenase [Chloroflexota bacterium]